MNSRRLILIGLALLLVLIMVGNLIAHDESVEFPDLSAEDQHFGNIHFDSNSEETKSSLYPMNPDRKAQLIEYSQFKSVWRFVSFFIGIALMSLILFTGFSAKLRDWAQVGKKKFLILWLFCGMFLLVDFLLNLPFTIYRSFIVESDFGFMNQTFMEWFNEQLISLGLGMLFIVVPLWFLYKLIQERKNWWAFFAAGSIPFIVFIVIVTPIYIQPLFNDFLPVDKDLVRYEVTTLAKQLGIGNADIFQVNGSKQSTKVNAYVTGLFSSKRIVLYDTLIDNFTIDEIKFVMGHEMGHYIMNHMWYGLAMVVLFLCFALWLTNLLIHKVIARFSSLFKFDSLGDIASLPLIMIFVSVISFMFQPVTNGMSRYNEHQADIFGMENAGVSGEAAAIAFDKLAVFNLADPDPHPMVEFWFYSHPSLESRMEFVRNYEKVSK